MLGGSLTGTLIVLLYFLFFFLHQLATLCTAREIPISKWVTLVEIIKLISVAASLRAA